MKILLSGTYSSTNKGDAAMQVSTASALAAFGPPATEIEILAPFAERDVAFYSPIAVSYCNRRKLISATIDLARALFWRAGGRSNNARVKAALLGASVRSTADADILVDLSGDMLTEDYGAHVAYSHYIPLLRAVITGTPYMICAQSIGPFRITRPIARFILNRAAAITARDAITYDYLRNIGIDPSLVRQTADLAFLLPPAERHITDANMKAAGIPTDHAPLLGVSVSQLVAGKYDRRTGRKGSFVAMMAQVIGKLASEHGLDIIFTPHVTGPGAAKDDRVISDAVSRLLPRSVRSFVIQENLRPEEMKAIISRCRIFVGTRMHANIAALSSHVPTVAIAYSHKTPGIMRACDVEQFAISEQDLDAGQLHQLLARAYAQSDVICGTLKASIGRQQALARENIATVLSIAAASEQFSDPSRAAMEDLNTTARSDQGIAG